MPDSSWKPRSSWGRATPRPRFLAVSIAVHATAIGLFLTCALGRRAPVPEYGVTAFRAATTPETAAPPPAAVKFVPFECEPQPPAVIPAELPPLPEPFDAEAFAPEPSHHPVEPQRAELPPSPDWRARVCIVREVVPEPPVELAPTAPATKAAEPTALADHNDPPRYPPRAIRLGLQGRVMLEVTVCADGTVTACDVAHSSGHAILDRAAAQAVLCWRFRNGPGVVRLPVDFVIEG